MKRHFWKSLFLVLFLIFFVGIITLRFYSFKPELPKPAPDSKPISQESIELTRQATLKTYSEKPSDDLVQMFDRAITLSPNYYIAYENKGRLLIRMKRFKDAISCFQILETMDHANVPVLICHALCLDSLGDRGKSDEMLKNIIQAIPRYIDQGKLGIRDSKLFLPMIHYLLRETDLARGEFIQLRDSNSYPTMNDQINYFLAQMTQNGIGPDRWKIISP